MTHTRFYTNAGLSLALLFSAMPEIAQAVDAQTAEAAKPLERVTVIDAGDRVRVEIDGGRAMAYTMTANEAPASVVIELPGVQKGAGLQRMDINKPPLLHMVPSEVSEPKAGVQLSFMLTTAVKPDIHSEGSKLVIDFQKAQAGMENADRAQAPLDGDASKAALTQDRKSVV